MNLGLVLREAGDKLERGRIDDARLEAEVLLRHVLHLDRAALYATLEKPPSPEEYVAYQKAIERRLHGEPSAYISGHRDFFGLDFLVDYRVLIPRPETELLVETAIKWCHQFHYSTVADIGTGSGAIAVSLAVNLLYVDIIATDISAGALEIARENSRRHVVDTRITFRQGDLLEALPGTVDLLCANLPYVSAGELPPFGPLSYEPQTALNGGREGLDVLLHFCRQIPGRIKPDGGLLMEIGLGQAEQITAVLHTALPSASVSVLKDLAGIERLIAMRLT